MVIILEPSIRTRSGSPIPRLTPDQAEARHFLSGDLLRQLHLEPKGDPSAYTERPDGSILYYYDPQRVREAPAEQWYRVPPPPPPPPPLDPMTLESGRVIGRMSVKHAASLGYYTKERLAQMHYDAGAEPAAYNKRSDQTLIWFFDKKEAVRQPLPCVRCGKRIRYRHKLCEKCYELEMNARRAEGDAHRAAFYHAKRERTLFFDLELTGVYDHDEILSVSIMNGRGDVLMDTLIRPVRKRKWKETEKIHGITPEMVTDAPTLASVTPEIKQMFADADAIIAYGIATDYSHIKMIYATDAERQALRRKTRCAAIEFGRYLQEHHPDLTHQSLSDAMEVLGLTWDGIAHTSIADTIACAKVWEALFPNYYDD